MSDLLGFVVLSPRVRFHGCQEPGPSSSNMRQRVFGLEEELRHKCEAAASSDNSATVFSPDTNSRKAVPNAPVKA